MKFDTQSFASSGFWWGANSWCRPVWISIFFIFESRFRCSSWTIIRCYKRRNQSSAISWYHTTPQNWPPRHSFEEREVDELDVATSSSSGLDFLWFSKSTATIYLADIPLFWLFWFSSFQNSASSRTRWNMTNREQCENSLTTRYLRCWMSVPNSNNYNKFRIILGEILLFPSKIWFVLFRFFCAVVWMRDTHERYPLYVRCTNKNTCKGGNNWLVPGSRAYLISHS